MNLSVIQRIFILLASILSCYYSLAQQEFRAMVEFGPERAIYQMESNHPETIAPKEWVYPFCGGILYKHKAISFSLLYENRNFGMAGPRYRNLDGGNNGFLINLWERMQSVNLQVGVDLTNPKSRFELTPEVGFGLGYFGGYSISQNEPSLDDYTNYRTMRFYDQYDKHDSRLVQSANMHYVITSKYVPWVRMMFRFSYELTPRFVIHSRLIYNHGLIPFFKSKFIIHDETLDEPILGTNDYYGSSLGVRFGISYSLPQKKNEVKHLP